jgi:two-component system LytT family sensor kinase
MMPSPSHRLLPSRPAQTPWLPILGIWTVYGLLMAVQMHVSGVLSGATSYTWGAALLLQLPQAYVWALATPGIMWLGRRFPLEGSRWPYHIGLHLVVSLGFVFAIDVGYSYHVANVLPTFPPPHPLMYRAVRLFAVWAFADSFLYWLILAVDYGIEHHRRLREREVAAARLQTQLVEADLQALKMQLHPHFLFNALHTIGALVRTGDDASAIRVVAGLGNLLRRVLDEESQQEVSLRHELEFIRNYLGIEQVRFRDRLKVEFEIEPSTLDAAVPHLILQPLVENAIRHGISPHARPGLLVVRARSLGSTLQLVVRDNGPGLDSVNADSGRPGIGIANTRARLQHLYGDAFTFDVRNAEAGGLEVRITVPFRLVTDTAA